MGWLARVMVPAVAMMFVGCAAIANLGEAQLPEEGDAQVGSSGASGTSGSSGTGTGGTSGTSGTSGMSGAPNDGGTTADARDAANTCPSPKVQNGLNCNAASDCCSNACTEDHKCNGKCSITTNGLSCSPLRNDECCVGSYCSAKAFGACVLCHPSNSPAETSAGGANAPVASSCCSGHADPASKMCVP